MSALHLQFWVSVVAGWMSRSQQHVIEYLQAENRVLREQLGGKRLRLTDAQRRRLAQKAKKGRSSRPARAPDAGHSRHVAALVPEADREEV